MLITIYALFLRNLTLVAGFAADSNCRTAVVVNSAFGKYAYLYIYDDNGRLLKTVTMNNTSSIDGVTVEDELICMYKFKSKCFYDFAGNYQKTEHTEEYHAPPFEHEKTIGNVMYKYSINLIGFETVTMHTPENTVTLFSGVSHWLTKIFTGLMMSITMILIVYVIIFPEYNFKT